MSYPPLDAGPHMGGRKLFAYQLFLIGIRDPGTVERLWREDQAKLAAERAKQPRRRRR